jgi:hypothetical protein
MLLLPASTCKSSNTLLPRVTVRRPPGWSLAYASAVGGVAVGVPVGVRVAVPVEVAVAVAVGVPFGVQLGNLKAPTLVSQNACIAGMYSLVYQKVQSSDGSTERVL